MSDPISNGINDPVLKSILKPKDHPSIKAIRKISKLNSLFKFSNVEKREILNEIVNLDASKSCQDTDVPTKIIKENADIFADFIHPAINTTINKNEFPSFLKLADVIPVFKKGSKNSKHNYRPISILKNISKVFERVMFKQIGDFMENYFSKFQCGFRKGYSTQQCLIALIEKWKSATDKGKFFGSLLTYRSSHSELFLGKGVLKICSKFTGEHSYRSAISIKLQIALRHGCSPVNLLHILRTPFQHTYLRPFFVSHMNCSLLNSMLMVSV